MVVQGCNFNLENKMMLRVDFDVFDPKHMGF
jgi:hypothetical protein